MLHKAPILISAALVAYVKMLGQIANSAGARPSDWSWATTPQSRTTLGHREPSIPSLMPWRSKMRRRSLSVEAATIAGEIPAPQRRRSTSSRARQSSRSVCKEAWPTQADPCMLLMVAPNMDFVPEGDCTR